MRIKTAIAFGLFVCAPAFAEGVKAEPGKWVIASTATAEMHKQGQTQALPTQSGKMTICVSDSDPYLSPKSFSHSQCEISDRQTEPQKLYYKMTCLNGPMEIVGGVSVDMGADRKSATGIMNYTVSERNADLGSEDYTYIRMDMTLTHAGPCE